MNTYLIVVALFMAIAATAGIAQGGESTYVPTGEWSGTLRYGSFGGVGDCAYDSSGTLFITDTAKDCVMAVTGQHVWRVYGTGGDGRGEFRSPEGIVIGPDGRIYVVDAGNHRVQVLAKDGSFRNAWSTGECRRIAYDLAGAVYLVDKGAKRVMKYSLNGHLLTSWGTIGDGPGQFREPGGIAVDRRTGQVYVVDRSRCCILVFTPGGRFVREWGTRGSEKGQFDDPVEVAVAPDGTVWVADVGNDRIERFSSTGIWRGRIALSEVTPGGMAVAPNGRLAVCDLQTRTVGVYAVDGRRVDRFGSGVTGSDPERFTQPKALVTDGKQGLYVVDASLSTLQKVSGTDGRLAWGTEPGRYFSAATAVTVGRGDTVYAASYHDGGVKMFTKDGRYLGSFGSGICGGAPHIADLASAPNGDIFALSCDRIFRFDRNGRLVTSWGGLPTGIVGGLAVSKDGTVHLGDMTNRWVRRFTPNGAPLAPLDLSASVRELQWFTFDGTGRLYVMDASGPHVVIFDSSGAPITSFATAVVGPMTVDRDRTVYIVSWTDHMLMRYSPLRDQAPAPTGTGTASFSGTPTSGKRSLMVRFTDTSTGSPTGWTWEFLGGSVSPPVSTQRNPTAWFNEGKQYTVRLTVTYQDGRTSTATKTGYVKVLG